MTRQTRQETARAVKARQPVCNCALVVHRRLQAVAPSGATLEMYKWMDCDDDLAMDFDPKLTAAENDQAWDAHNKAKRGGIDKWNEAIKILVKSGWRLL